MENTLNGLGQLASLISRRINKSARHLLWRMRTRIPHADRWQADRAFVKLALDEIRGLAESSDFSGGSAVETFEKEFAALAGAKYAVGVNSGTDALYLGMKCLGIGPGDEVITSGANYISTVIAIGLLPAKIVLVDVLEDGNIDPALVEAAITPRTKAVIAVHSLGRLCDLKALTTICTKHGVALIEDVAQAAGAKFEGKPAGSFGPIGCFSLHPLKEPHVWGDGGVITTDSPEHYERLKKMRNLGMNRDGRCEFFGHNSRLDSIQAAVGRCSLKAFPEVMNARRRHVAHYTKELDGLEPLVTLPPADLPGNESVHCNFAVRSAKRDELIAYLAARGIEAQDPHEPSHFHPVVQAQGYRIGDFPITERLAKEQVYLPIRHTLTDSELRSICRAIRQFAAAEGEH